MNKEAISNYTSVAVCPLFFRTDVAVAWSISVNDMPLTLAILSPSLQSEQKQRIHRITHRTRLGTTLLSHNKTNNNNDTAIIHISL